MTAFLNQMMQKTKVRGVAYFLIEPCLRIHFGEAGKTGRPGLALNQRTVFEAASLTKPVFALLVFVLRDLGLIDLDRPVAELMPHSVMDDDPRHRLVTPRHLLAHSGGFQNWRRDEKLRIHFEPGEAFRYSGEGYVYLQRAVESITGLPLACALDRYVLAPLNMNDTSLVWTEDIGARLTACFDREGRAEEPQPMCKANAAYSLYTTPRDYARFIRELMAPAVLLSEQSVQEMLRPQVALNWQLLWSHGWGTIRSRGGARTYWQWGDNGNFTSFAWFTPQEQSAMVMFANSANGLVLAHETALHYRLHAGLAFSEFLCRHYESSLRAPQ